MRDVQVDMRSGAPLGDSRSRHNLTVLLGVGSHDRDEGDDPRLLYSWSNSCVEYRWEFLQVTGGIEI
jgi:hypothetical protein